LAELHAGQTENAITFALASGDPELHTAAMPYLDRLEGADTVALLSGPIRALESATPLATEPPVDNRVYLAQAAIDALGKTPAETANEVLGQALKGLAENRLPASLALNLTAAASRRGGTLVTAALDRQAAIIQGNPSLGRYWDCRTGGNPERGKKIFQQKTETECLRCHAVQGNGGTVGPTLDGLANRAPRDQILESIVLPNARIASGFETASVQLADGRVLVGRIKSESDTKLAIESPNETGELELQELAKSQIQKREAASSPMPEGLAEKLTPFELRDLIAYLAGLK
jgi:quinoprotein glucose dehydrogenase